MNIEKAIEIMKIEKNDLKTIDSLKLKKIYHTRALKLHPDKGGSDDDFKELQEAYDFLNIIIDLNDYKSSDNNYENYFNMYKMDENLFDKLKYYIFKYVNKVSLSYIDECDPKQINNLEKILDFYKGKIPFGVYNKIAEIINNNKKSDKSFTLNPSINDLFENKIYRFNYNSEIFNVPLWHSELYYDTNTKEEICINCIPQLHPFVDIDSENNIHVFIFEKLSTIFKQQYFDVKLSDKINFRIFSNEINLLPSQQIILKNKGISKITGTNIYDTKYKSNIIINLNISHE